MHEGTTGTPSTVVCVHGAGGGGWEWTIWARVLAGCGFDVLAPDLMPAPGGIAATRLRDYEQQVAGWCRGAGDAPVLIGASLGGLLALRVARRVRPAALVLVNAMPPGGIAGAAPSPPVIPWHSRRSFASTRRAMPDCDDASRLFAYRRWRDESGAVLDAARAGMSYERPHGRVLVLASDMDEEIPLAASRRLAGQLGAEFEQIGGASHLGPLLGRSAARVAERVGEWLVNVRASGAGI